MFRRVSLPILSLIISVVCSAVEAQELRVFFGNLHSHTRYSDGSGLPTTAYKRAKQQAKLDFMAITEHNHKRCEGVLREEDPRKDGIMIGKDHTLYKGPQSSALIPQANNWTEDGKFVALYGQEYSAISRGNHINVFDVPEVIDVENGKFDKLVREWLPANKDTTGKLAVVQFNHPALFGNDAKEYGRDDFGSKAKWIKEMDEVVSLIEIINGPSTTKGAGVEPAEIMEADYHQFLNLGFHISPTADQDNHFYTWGTATHARTGIIATSLTKTNILEAMRARHTYATTDENLRIIVHVNGHLTGDRLAPPPAGSALSIEISLVDDDEPEADYDIQVFSDIIGGTKEAEVIEVFSIEGNPAAGEVYTLDDLQYSGGKQYVFFKFIQYHEHGNPDIAWTAPIWFDAETGGSAATDTGGVRIVKILPNPAGDETQKESITLKNTSSNPVNLAGWTVEDLTGKQWKLEELGTITAGAEKTIQRSGKSMALNNSGDVVTLKNGQTEVQTVQYASTPEGQVVTIEP